MRGMTATAIIKKHKLDTKDWIHKGFHGVLHFYFQVGEQAVRPMKNYFGVCYPRTVFFFHDNYGEWFWCKQDMVQLREWFIKRVNRDPRVLDRLDRDWHRALQEFDRVMAFIDKTDFRKLSNEQLYKLYRQWNTAYLKEYGMAIGIQDAFSMTADEFLFPQLKKAIEARGHGDKVNEYYELLMSPVTNSFLNEEHKDRLRLRARIKNIKNPTVADRKLLERHARRWHWINNNYARAMDYDAAYFLAELQKIEVANPRQEIRVMEQKLRATIRTKRALLKKLKLDGALKNLIRIVEVFADEQDKRKGYVLRAVHYQNRFLEEFRRRLKLDRQHAEYTYIYELLELFKKGKINPHELEERKRFSFVIHTLKGYEIYIGDDAEQVFKRIFTKEDKEVKELRGIVASRGVARGTVKIIKKIHDLANMKKGAILVASMTRPEMMSACQIASAIVTDEGGVTSHAAIVSRELGIPCIISTKIATQVLHDGDRVEVDAGRGIVRKLNH